MHKKGLLFVLFIAFASIVPTSCNKGTIEYKFEGKVTSALTGAPLTDVDVTLSQKLIQNGLTGDDHKLAAADISDENGEFDFTIDREKVTEFLFEYEKDLYFPLIIEESSANVSTEDINVYNEEMEPKSWIQIEITNNFPIDTDHIKIITQNFREGCYGCGENKQTEFFGAVDTVFNYLTTGGSHAKITYINVNTGYSVTDSIYATPFETIIYPITY